MLENTFGPHREITRGHSTSSPSVISLMTIGLYTDMIVCTLETLARAESSTLSDSQGTAAVVALIAYE